MSVNSNTYAARMQANQHKYTMRIDLFAYQGNTLSVDFKSEVDIDDYNLRFMTAREFGRDSIDVLTTESNDIISIGNDTYTLAVNITPSKYTALPHVYTVQTVHQETGVATMIQSGRIFIESTINETND
jgi:hypothetical protein